MKRHPALGYEILKSIKFLEGARLIPLHHQERFDGTGYPSGLAGEQICLGARIFAVVDTYDAITSDRPYRAARTYDVAREEIRKHAGTQFDPRVVDRLGGDPRRGMVPDTPGAGRGPRRLGGSRPGRLLRRVGSARAWPPEMKSFSDRPPTECVQMVTSTLL